MFSGYDSYDGDWYYEDEEVEDQKAVAAVPLRISIPPIYGSERKDVLKILGRTETERSMFYSFNKGPRHTREKINNLLCYLLENPDFLEYYPTFCSILQYKIKEIPLENPYWQPLNHVVKKFLSLCASLGTDEYKATLWYHQFWEDYWVWDPKPKS